MATTYTTRKALTILLAAAGIIALALPRSADAEAQTPPTEIRIAAATEAQLEDARWALSRFETVGIELPSLTIVFHDNYEACGMRQGFLGIGGELVELHECMQDQEGRRRNLVHELTHAWDHISGGIDDETRQRFMELRGLTAWSDYSQEWNQRGEEQAAEIVAWGMMDGFAPIPTSVGEQGPQDVDSLTEAFQALTGATPLFLGS